MRRTRAWRRWQYQKRKMNRKHYWGGPVGTEPGVRYMQTEEERLGMVANTPQPCSCIGGCGHMRQAYGPTIQERKAAEDAQAQIEEQNKEAGRELSQAA